MRHTTVEHRDDIVMTLADMPLRRTASQGQTKTFTTALRLAQYEFLREATGMRPLLLLDDIFDKLDSRRVERIIQLVASRDFGQIFITDTNRKHLDEIVSHMAKRLQDVDGERRHIHSRTMKRTDPQLFSQIFSKLVEQSGHADTYAEQRACFVWLPKWWDRA